MTAKNFGCFRDELKVVALGFAAVLVAGCSGRVVVDTPSVTAMGGAPNSQRPISGRPPSRSVISGISGASSVSLAGSASVGSGSGPISGDTSAVVAGGAPSVLVAGLQEPIAIAVYGSNVYFVDFGTFNNDGSVALVPAAGGGEPFQFALGQQGPGGLAVNQTGVYWSVATLMRASLDGMNQISLVAGMVNDPIAVGPSGIYGTGSLDGMRTTVVSAPLTGGSLTALAPDALAPSDASYGFAIDATSIYWTTFNDPTSIRKMPLQGGMPVTLATSPGAGGGLAVDKSNVYWVSSNGVMKVAIDGGPATLLGPSGPVAGLGGNIALDDTSVYWTTADSVLKVSLSGGTPEVLASGQPGPIPIAVDATSVYWGNTRPGAGSIMKLTPK